MDYAMPRADDVPSFDVDSHQVPTRVNALGAKGVGETGTVGSLLALLNAVNDALAPLGVRHLDMPVTAERGLARDPGREGPPLSGGQPRQPAAPRRR
jgi:carbon-monoxide dehydrogenase large subunit